MEVRMTVRSDDDEHGRAPRPEAERADVPCSVDGDSETERDDEDGYGFGV